VFTLRDLDVCLVLAVTPFVLIGGMPTLGYLVEAGALAAGAGAVLEKRSW
jgi:hypothetical protein